MTFLPLATALFVVVIAFFATLYRWFTQHEAWLARQEARTDTFREVLEDAGRTEGGFDDPRVWYHQGTYMFIWALAIVAWAICCFTIMCVVVLIVGASISSISRGLEATHYYYVNGYWEKTLSSEFFGEYNHTRARELKGLSPLKEGQWTVWFDGREIVFDSLDGIGFSEGREILPQGPQGTGALLDAALGFPAKPCNPHPNQPLSATLSGSQQLPGVLTTQGSASDSTFSPEFAQKIRLMTKNAAEDEHLETTPGVTSDSVNE